jgi:hypothetical protein
VGFDELMDAAQSAYRSGRNAAKRGIWYLALYEYGRALGLLEAGIIFIDSGVIHMDDQQNQAFAALLGGIRSEYLKAVRLSGNGHPKENPAPGFSEAIDAMKEDLDEIMS